MTLFSRRCLYRAIGISPLVCASFFFANPANAQERLRLWPDAPEVAQPEIVEHDEDGRSVIRDVIDPSLTVYLPDREIANGAAVIIAPGGALRVLGVPDYENSTARWLNEQGVAAFVLHYRLLPSSHELEGELTRMDDFPRGNANPFPDDLVMSQTIDNAIADGQRAVEIVRANAEAWDIDPDRVGMLGISAGGAVILGATVRPSDNGRPDFLISSFGPSVVDVELPEDAPPLFMAVRQFHPNVARALVALWQVWTDAEGSAELHIYQQLGERPFLAPTGKWLEDAYFWMQERGIVPSPANLADEAE